MAYEIIWETTGAQFVFKKEATSENVRQSNKEFALDARFPSAMYALYNLIDVKKFPIVSKDIKKIAEMDAMRYKINPDMKVAIIGTQPVMKGIIYMYNVYFGLASNTNIWETKIFDSIDDARKWIDT